MPETEAPLTEINRQKALGESKVAAAKKDAQIKAAAAAKDHADEEGKRVVIGPMGTVLKVRPLAEIRTRFANPGDLLTQFDKLLKKYEPKRFEYGWANNDDETAGLCRAGNYILVDKDEVLPDTPLPIHYGTANEVKWMSLVLVKIPREYYESTVGLAQEMALSVLVRDNVEQWKDRVVKESKGLAELYEVDS